MLDSETKRRIDTARDILVGKVPDPKSQVEQITIALIYKFMDDMDKESIGFGGEAVFFTGDYDKYSWTKIFDTKVGGHEMLNLYGEAIVKLNQNPNIPQLFRDIFKNAYLPYRDPETLKLFLKTINEFTYDHSEKLGDAFEYLLSVLGSQGDAGQFRTPRHIIDFIVAVMQPKKNETICDPACGTAGFLISSYKHIQKDNTNKTKGDLLTPDDKKKLMQNFVGYDISPDMVRLSLVNMYLHNFTAPRIYEYDTLTSEDRWGEYFDVIMANPPFMTPKGGIKPHKKFTMQANRSEVLFVDYIAEHIHPSTGRAGVIVPEGIIFQSAIAYKALRKLLVDKDLLFAVVSLPSGVFQPYSGVKTSILLMDKTLAKKTNKILFLKLENDGYSLGAQRKELPTSEIPDAIKFIKDYQTALRNSDYSIINLDSLPLQSLLVEKTKIAETDDYNLSADRYRINDVHNKAKYEIVSLGDVCSFIGGYAFKSAELLDDAKENALPVIKIGNLHKEGYLDLSDVQYYTIDDDIKKYLVKKDDILMAMTGATVGKVAISDRDNVYLNQRVGLIRANEELINKDFLKALLLSAKFYEYCQYTAGGGAQGNISPTEIMNFKFPLPPLIVQELLAYSIKSYNEVVSGARQILSAYKPQINFDPEWETVELGNVCKTEYGYGDTAKDTGEARYIRITDINENGTIKNDEVRYVDLNEESKKYLLKKGDLVVARTGATYGKTLLFEEDYPCVFASFLIRLNFDSSKILNKYYWMFTQSSNYLVQKQQLMSGGAQPQFNANAIIKIKIPLPPLDVQEQIVSSLNNEIQLLNHNHNLIHHFTTKISETINGLWKD